MVSHNTPLSGEYQPTIIKTTGGAQMFPGWNLFSTESTGAVISHIAMADRRFSFR